MRTVPPSVLRWVFHSPARLTLVCVIVAGIIVGGSLLSTGISSDERQGEVAQATSPPAPSTTGTPSPAVSERVDRRAGTRAVHTARTFVNAWLSGQSMPTAQWRRALRPLTTASLYAGLRSTDPVALPSGDVVSVRLEELGPFATGVLVRLTSGMVLRVDLVAEHGRWAVSNIQPAGT